MPNEHKIFVEFGVGDYYESNTRLLLNADRNWRGLVIEGDPKEVERIKNHENFGNIICKLCVNLLLRKALIKQSIPDYL